MLVSRAHRQVASEQHGLEGVVHAKVEATVHDDTDAADGEATVQACNTVTRQGLLVHINQAIELALAATLLGGLGVVGKAGTGVVEWIDEGQRAGTGGTSRGKVA